MRTLRLAVASLVCLPALASAQVTTDAIGWPSEGVFPAYPADRIDRRVEYSVSGGIYRDDNVFRLSDSANAAAIIGTSERSDTITRLGVGIRVNLPVSRQRFRAEAQLNHLNYDRFGQLDHDAYRLLGVWDWQFGNQWSGDLGYGTRRYLASLAEVRAKDLVTEDRIFLNAGYQLTPRWRVRGGLDWFDFEHSAAARNVLDSEVTATTLGADYVTPAGNSIGGQVRFADGRYPNREVIGATAVDNRYDEVETSAVARWELTGKSRLDARLGHTSRKHDQVPARNFSGATGRLGFDWLVTPRTGVNFAVFREARSVEDLNASYVIAKGFSVGPRWAPSVRIVLQGRLVWEEQDYRGDPAISLAAGAQRSDKFNGISLAGGYEFSRNLEFSLHYDFGKRTSNIALRDYDFNAIAANAKFSF